MLNVTCFTTSFILQRVRYAILFIVCSQHQPIENCETKGFSIKRLYNLSNIFLPMFSLVNLSPCLSTDDIYSLRLRNLHHLISKLQFSRLSLLEKNSCFQLIHSPSCYRAVQLANHIQSCSLNQPITILVSITIETVHRPWFLNLAILLFLKIVIFIIN